MKRLFSFAFALLVAAALGAAISSPPVRAQVGPAPVQPVSIMSSTPLPISSLPPVSPATTFPVSVTNPCASASAVPTAIPSVSATPSNVATVAGRICEVDVQQNLASPIPVFVQIYNAPASSVTVGTTKPVKELYCASSGTAQHCVQPLPVYGIPLSSSTGYSIGCTTTSVFSGASWTGCLAGVTAFPVYVNGL